MRVQLIVGVVVLVGMLALTLYGGTQHFFFEMVVTTMITCAVQVVISGIAVCELLAQRARGEKVQGWLLGHCLLGTVTFGLLLYGLVLTS